MTSSGLSRIGAGSRIGTAITVFTQLAGWSVALAGIAILQQCCNSNNRDFHTSTGLFGLGPNVFEQSIVGAPGAVPLGQPSGYDCGMQYSWYWWVLALQFVCVIAGIFPAIIPFSGSKLLLVALYAIVTTHWCILAYAMNWMTYVYQRWGSDYNTENRWRTGYTTAYAGAIIVLVANFAYLFNLAAEEMAKEVAEGRAPGQRGGGKNIDTPEVGTAGPGTTTTLAV